jgi:hypothetical protein
MSGARFKSSDNFTRNFLNGFICWFRGSKWKKYHPLPKTCDMFQSYYYYYYYTFSWLVRKYEAVIYLKYSSFLIG